MRILQPVLAGLSALSALAPTAAAYAQQAPAVDAKIEIVWPHDARGNQASVATALLVNVEVYLFRRGTLDPVGCGFGGTPDLHFAVNEEYFGQGHGVGGDQTVDQVEPVQPQKITRTVDGKTFPVWVFNDVPISPPYSTPYLSNVTTYFFVDVPGYDMRTNVWGHGADPRTFEPSQTVAQSTADSPITPVESIIQIVWPHDRQGNWEPVAQAPLANVSVDLFRYPLFLAGQAVIANPGIAGPRSEPFSFTPTPQLLKSLNTGYLDPVGRPAQEIRETNTTFYQRPVAWPRWDFDDVDVSAASDPLNKYYFMVRLPGVENHTTVWAHGADARTVFPQRDVPTSSGAGC